MFKILLAAVLLSAPAHAQDADPFGDLLTNDDDESFGTDPAKPAPTPTNDPNTDKDEPAPLDEPTDADTLTFEDPIEGETDLLGEEPDVVIGGGDTAAIYRMNVDRGAKLDTDEEMQLWDAYLAKYPDTAFRPQIESRRQDLEAKLYTLGNRPGREEAGTGDATFRMAHPILLENINPQDRLLVVVEYGLPDYASVGIDVEKEVADKLSLHGGFRRRFTGGSIELGARYALLRSLRTNTLLSAALDVRVNTGPAFVAFRPVFGFGKSFGKVDLQAQFGAELAPRQVFDVRFVGGLNTTYRASEAISLVGEAVGYVHTKSGAAGPYRFNQFTFGMKFFPAQKRENPEDIEFNVAATLPFSSSYWQFHYGSIVLQLVYKL